MRHYESAYREPDQSEQVPGMISVIAQSSPAGRQGHRVEDWGRRSARPTRSTSW